MEDRENCKEECEFTVHPCNFKVQLREIKPFLVHMCKPLVLDLKVLNCCNANSSITIKTNPMHGQLYLLDDSSILIYKSNRRFCGLDLFQILIEDEYGEKRIESILIRIVY